MAKVPGSGANDEGAPTSQPQGPPRDLYDTSDIRFVMREVATLTERVDHLISAVSAIPDRFEKALDRQTDDLKERIGDLKSGAKESRDRLGEIDKTISFGKGALWVIGACSLIVGPLLGWLLNRTFPAAPAAPPVPTVIVPPTPPAHP